MKPGQSSPSSPIDPNAGTAPGQRLRAARERRRLSVQQVADDLHVGVSTIEALEAGQLASLGAPVHGKGHLRRYATLLGLDAEALLAAYEIAQPAPELVPLKPATRRARFRISRTAVAAVVAAVTAIALGWVLANRKVARPPEPRPSVVENSPPKVEASPAPETAIETPVAAVPAAVTAPAAARPNEGAGAAVARVRIQMSFSADSWVEIYDAGEQRVFFDMGATGTSRAISAEAPLRVFLGYTDGVRLELDGQVVAVPAEVRRGNLAEFSLDARGHVGPRPRR
jgi:cytoskeleton protein RodZ